MPQNDKNIRWFLLLETDADYEDTRANLEAWAPVGFYTIDDGFVADTKVVKTYMTDAEIAGDVPSLVPGDAAVLDRMDYGRLLNVAGRSAAITQTLHTNAWGDQYPVWANLFLKQPQAIPTAPVDRIVSHWKIGGEVPYYFSRDGAGTKTGLSYLNAAEVADLISDGSGAINSAIDVTDGTIFIGIGPLFRFQNEGKSDLSGYVSIQTTPGTEAAPTIFMAHPINPGQVFYGRPLGSGNTGGGSWREAADWTQTADDDWYINIGSSVLEVQDIIEQRFAYTIAGGTGRPLDHSQTRAEMLAGGDRYFIPMRRRGYRNTSRTYVPGERHVYKNYPFVCCLGHTDQAPPEPIGTQVLTGTPNANAYWSQVGVWEYSAATTYVLGDQATSDFITNYVCILGHTNQALTNTTYWIPFTALALHNSGTTYAEGEVSLKTTALGSDPFAYTDGSSVLTVTHTAHDLLTGTPVTFSGAAIVGGIAASFINTEFAITVVNANSYTVDVQGATASGTGSGGGASVGATAFYLCILGHSNQIPPNATYWTSNHRVYANLADASNPRLTTFFGQIATSPGVNFAIFDRESWRHFYGVDFFLGGPGDVPSNTYYYGVGFYYGCAIGNHGGFVDEGDGSLDYQTMAQCPVNRRFVGCEGAYGNVWFYDTAGSNAVAIDTIIKDTHLHHFNLIWTLGVNTFADSDAHTIATQGQDGLVIDNVSIHDTGSQQITFYMIGANFEDPATSGLGATEGIDEGFGFPEDTVDNGDGSILYGGRCKRTLVTNTWIRNFWNEVSHPAFIKPGHMDDMGIGFNGDAPLIGIASQYADNIVGGSPGNGNRLEGPFNNALRHKFSFVDDTGPIVDYSYNIIRGAAVGFRSFFTTTWDSVVYDPSYNFHHNDVHVEPNAVHADPLHVTIGNTGGTHLHYHDNNTYRTDDGGGWYTGAVGIIRTAIADWQGDEQTGDTYDPNSVEDVLPADPIPLDSPPGQFRASVFAAGVVS